MSDLDLQCSADRYLWTLRNDPCAEWYNTDEVADTGHVLPNTPISMPFVLRRPFRYEDHSERKALATIMKMREMGIVFKPWTSVYGWYTNTIYFLFSDKADAAIFEVIWD